VASRSERSRRSRRSRGPAPARDEAAGARARGRPFDTTVPSDAPVDPWRAVNGNRPRVLPHESQPYLDDTDAVCDAAHDHCLRDCSWLVSHELPPYRTVPVAREAEATERGFASVGYSDDDPYQAFRSVPVTRKNLEVGRLVLVTEDPPRVGSSWYFGYVEDIDWDAETVRLRDNRHDPYPLAWTRVAVLRYENGGQVEVVNGFSRGDVAIAPDELFLPR
jgi:hypothetical protein